MAQAYTFDPKSSSVEFEATYTRHIIMGAALPLRLLEHHVVRLEDLLELLNASDAPIH
jgi:hypothetical protein